MQHLKIKKNEGYILLVVLIFLQIITLFTLYEYDNIRITNFSKNLLFHRDFLLQDAEDILKNIEAKELEELPQCVTKKIPPEILKENSINWWQEHACLGNVNRIDYYFIIETLGSNPCIYFPNIEISGGSYYRISLLAINVNQARVMLQSVILLPSSNNENCQSVLINESAGRQSWRAGYM